MSPEPRASVRSTSTRPEPPGIRGCKNARRRNLAVRGGVGCTRVLIRAAKMEIKAKQDFDVGIVIPLSEEFRYVLEFSPQLESIQYEGDYFYRLGCAPVSVVCCLAGQMGTLPAMHAATRLLRFAEVKVLVLLGLAGGLDSNVQVGDVVVAEEVNEFQANSKAQSTGGGYEVHYSGRHWPLEFAIKEVVRHFEHSCPQGFSKWQEQVTRDFAELSIPKRDTVCSLPATLHIGPIASGNIVAASSAFVEEVRRINRKFLAIDMEAAGVTFTATERVHRVQWLVVRGVSDRADENKKALDDEKGAWRRYCVRNAIGFLWNLLAWEDFIAACGLKSSAEGKSEQHLESDLLPMVRSRVGAPWLVGVAFGLYSHGPRVSGGGTVIPMDLSQLRILDPRVDQLVKSSTELREQLFVTGDLQAAVNGFTTLADDYRNQLGSNDVDTLLHDFDRVVTETVCPSDHEHIEAVLLEADRLEEQIGPQAVAEFLDDLLREDPRLRQRYVEVLAVLQNWTDIIEMLNDVEPDSMSRSELDELIFSYAKTDDFGSAEQTLQLHRSRYDDSSAQMFRKQLVAQFGGLRKNSDGHRD